MKVRGEDEQSREWDFNRASSTAIAFENREIWALLKRVLSRINTEHISLVMQDSPMDINGLAMAYAVKKYAHNRRPQQAVGGFFILLHCPLALSH